MPWRFENNTLTAPDRRTWPARSGPFGRGRIDPGKYRLGPVTAIDPNAVENEPFRDPCGLAWWCPLTPLFDTIRTGLGLHPDGNIPGTEGCVGITADNTRTLFFALKKSPDRILIVV